MGQEKSNRYDFIDIGKAICIIGVVIFHLVLGPEGGEGLVGTTGKILNSSVNYLNFILPFFYFASAFTYKRGLRSPKESIKRRLKNLVLPFLIIFLFLTLLASLYYWAVQGQRFTSVLAKDLLTLAYGSGVFPVEIPAIDLFRNAEGRIFPSSSFVSVFWYMQAFIPASLVFYPIVESLTKEKMGHNYRIYKVLMI